MAVQLKHKVAKLMKSGIEIKGATAVKWHEISQVLESLNYTRGEITNVMQHLGSEYADKNHQSKNKDYQADVNNELLPYTFLVVRIFDRSFHIKPFCVVCSIIFVKFRLFSWAINLELFKLFHSLGP